MSAGIEVAERALVGRERELAELDRAIADAARGHGRVVVLRGEAGIGKTTLVRAVLGRCERAGFACMVGAAVEIEQRRPFGVVAQALGVDDVRDGRLIEIGELLRGRGGRGASALTDSATLEFRVAELATEYVQAVCAKRRVAVLLEDLHWADPSSLLAVHRFAQAAADLRLLLVCTLRPYPERRELRALLESLERIGAVRLAVEPLDAEEVRALAETVAGAPLSAALARRIEALGGNPLFLTEFLAALEAEGRLGVSSDGADATPGGALPPSLRLMILRRLSTLPDATLEALRVSSALGARFSVSELGLALRRPVVALAEALRPATDAGVLVEAGERLAFRHDVIHEAIYEDLPLGVRRALHRELGSVLSDAGAPSERVAAHMLRGAEPGDTEAIEWLRRAGRDAAARAPVVAAELLEGALALTPAGAPARDEIRAELVSPLIWSGRGADVVSLCREALEESSGDGDDLFRLGLARGLFTQGRLLEARAEFEAVARSPSLPDHTRPRVAAFAAYLGAFLKDRRAADTARALLASFPEGPVAILARLALAADALFDARSDVGLEQLDRLTQGESADWLPLRLLRGMMLLDLDRIDEARETLRDGLQRGLGVGATAGLALYRVYLVAVEYYAANFDASIAEHEAAVALARETGQRWLVASYAFRGLVAVQRGELDEAERAIAAAEAERHDVGPQYGFATAPLARARLAEARGDTHAAVAAVKEAHELVDRYEPRSHSAWHAPHLARIALGAGHRDQAEAVAATAETAAARGTVASLAGSALLARGIVEGDAEALLGAVDRLRQAQRPLELALALECAAEALARANHEADARPLASEALSLYRSRGVAADEARAKGRLRATGLRVGAHGRRGRPASGWESLTEAELRVVRLLAQGRSNPEIAERLYLTRRTVRAHVSSALRKLDVSSRVELAAEAARRGL